jgi:hypothetical protein
LSREEDRAGPRDRPEWGLLGGLRLVNDEDEVAFVVEGAPDDNGHFRLGGHLALEDGVALLDQFKLVGIALLFQHDHAHVEHFGGAQAGGLVIVDGGDGLPDFPVAIVTKEGDQFFAQFRFDAGIILDAHVLGVDELHHELARGQGFGIFGLEGTGQQTGQECAADEDANRFHRVTV